MLVQSQHDSNGEGVSVNGKRVSHRPTGRNTRQSAKSEARRRAKQPGGLTEQAKAMEVAESLDVYLSRRGR